ncbi:hypothetical protein HBI56_204520 [Parastagonospora nodorum]|uniref:Uncharacterized protein n=2 Tax=Phaeosphaeria nodorum (strain SN15 / ATCC MYA-4574 / FGSC 10173) TaxID=321614 RepID=A0A7U2FGR1_PHANO|nr:hypothetical protein SNOG_10883 [Parastagonospora nodorum SN15]KAH3912394.1 hypothetical protein HBH56_114510 [Parastagonospora nodorum]EAT81382.1 hypothetical protein SNOG_10883 [Parastagonospora nodorum SN15]KAH3928952.1 hypothetical protein HBH54_134640 [Parastagonospora nodorum]KAH3950554.1 hypothetical protein HBH53_074920 [Parastagonospora nodorum]KAH3965812.1 hypothetical protein HBH51_146840 [Parastagonospora nodorum]
MKLHTGLIAKLFLFLRVLDSVSAASAASEELGVDRNDPVYRAALIEECGDLGVLDVPEGQPESEIRHCKEHPRWRDPTFVPDFAALAEKEAKLTAESRRAINMDAQMDLAGGFVDRAEAGAGLRLERGMDRG